MIHPKEWWELSKDVAALANHVGGTLIVGAQEPEPGNAPKYHGISRIDAEKFARAYEQAVMEHCRPRPIARPVPVDLPGGQQVLAVNVEPFPDQPVGTRFPSVDQKGQPKPSTAWQFPVRVGRDIMMLTPDQLPLLTNARVRRIVILLEQIPQPLKYGRAVLVWRNPSNSTTTAPVETPLMALSVSAFENLLTTELVMDTAVSKLWIPLDDVETVWRGANDSWFIRVLGFIATSGGRVVGYLSNPSNTVLRV